MMQKRNNEKISREFHKDLSSPLAPRSMIFVKLQMLSPQVHSDKLHLCVGMCL